MINHDGPGANARSRAAASDEEEATGLLAAHSSSSFSEDPEHGYDPYGVVTGGPEDEDEEDGVLVSHGDNQSPSDVAGTTTTVAAAAAARAASARSRTRSPRTPNRVRFDLRPTIVGNGGERNGSGAGAGSGAEQHYHYARDSFDVDDEDPLNPDGTAARGAGRGGRGGRRGEEDDDDEGQQQRLPLLTDIEAPAVAVANGRWGSGDDAHDEAEAEQRRPKSEMLSAFMNMANSIIGAGIIGQPYAFRQAGLLSGAVLLVLLTVVVDWTIRLIVVNSKLSGASSFQGTVEHCFGRAGLVAISVAQWAFAFGGMVAFGIIVGDSIPHVLIAVWPELRSVPVLGLLADRRAVIVVFVLGVSYPLTLYRDIAKLAKASTLALISMCIIIITVIVQGILAPKEERGSIDKSHLFINDGIFQAIGVISFAFVCHHNSLLIYGSLKTPTIDRFTTVTHYSTGVSMLACLLMALGGFITFGDKTLGNVLNNFSGDNTMVNIARLCFGLNMLTTLPLEAFVCREVMLNYYFPGEPFNMNLHLIFSTSLVVAAMALSLVTCDLGSVFELVGTTSAAAMAYILPPLCYIKLTNRSWKTYVAVAVAVFGCAVMTISLLQSAAKIIKGEGGTAQCM